MPEASPLLDSLLPLAPRDYLILFALVDGGLHGHGILKAIESESGGVPFDPANLYRSLRKLERDGLVLETKPRRGDASAQRRRSYELTPLGRTALGAEAERLARLADSARKRKLLSRKQVAG